MKKISVLVLTLCLTMALAGQASALEYTFDAPDGPDYGKATSVDVIYTADGGARKNEDISKNAALIPPAFGNVSADTRGTGTYLTPNLAPGGMPLTDATINGSAAIVYPPSGNADLYTPSYSVPAGYTEVTDDMYYNAGHLGTLKIPSIDLSVNIYEGTDSTQLAKGAGHFEETSIWDGNVALAGHNRGVNNHFGKIHTLEFGDKISLTTKLGTRTYEVVSVSKVSYTDRSGLATSAENMITLYTCVQNQSAYRWCVQAIELK